MLAVASATDRAHPGTSLRQCVVDLDRLREQLGERGALLEAYALDGARSPGQKAALAASCRSSDAGHRAGGAGADRRAHDPDLGTARPAGAPAGRPGRERPPRLAAARDRGRRRRPRRRAARSVPARCTPRPGRSDSSARNRETEQATGHVAGGADGAVRDGDRWRRAGGPGGRLPPGPARPVVRDPGRQPAGRRRLAPAMGLAAPVHPGPLRRVAGDALPRARLVLSPPRTRSPTTWRLRRAVRAAGPTGVRVDRLSSDGGPVRAGRRRPPVRGRQRGGGLRRLPAAPDPRVRAPSSTRASCSCTPARTGTRPSYRPAACWWWAPATPEPRSPSKSPHPPDLAVRPGHRPHPRSAPAAGGTGCSPRRSGGSPRGC